MADRKKQARKPVVTRTPELDAPGQWVKYVMEAIVAFPIYFLIGLLPIDWASGLGGWLGRTIGPKIALTRRARRNLKNAYPAKTDGEIATIIRDMWDNLGRTFFEYPHLHKITPKGDNPRLEIVGFEQLEQFRQGGKAILFSGHFANWEILMIGSHYMGLDMAGVYRAPNNPLMEKIFLMRHPDKDSLIPKSAWGGKAMLRVLREDRQLGLMIDQKQNDGIPVPFFGRDAMTAPALAIFALKFKCPVFPTQIERLDGARFRVTVHPPMGLPASGDKDKDIENLMADVNSKLESWVRQRPGQWLWLHNRWPKN